MKDSFRPSKVKMFWKKITLQMTRFSFVAFSSFFTISSTKINNLNKYKVSKIDANTKLYLNLRWLEYAYTLNN
jgi:hypothetical protein